MRALMTAGSKRNSLAQAVNPMTLKSGKISAKSHRFTELDGATQEKNLKVLLTQATVTSAGQGEQSAEVGVAARGEAVMTNSYGRVGCGAEHAGTKAGTNIAGIFTAEMRFLSNAIYSDSRLVAKGAGKAGFQWNVQ